MDLLTIVRKSIPAENPFKVNPIHDILLVYFNRR